MLFNSLQFLLFFPIVVAAYYALPHRYRWVLLLAASYYFYMCWRATYIILIVISTLIDYYASVMMGRSNDQRTRRKYLVLSLVSNLGMLFVFKYFNFFNDSIRELLTALNMGYAIPALNVLLPVGISFYTFQTLSYTIDVYRGQREPETHFGIFALYVAFFPQLVAGPIERSTHLMPQFRAKISFDYQGVTDGLKLMLWGMFKKVVIADRVAVVVNLVYNQPEEYTGLPLIIATVLFAYQIYCDFSGYSDIAIGAARVLGFDLMTNFRRPYHAHSISDFWSRWHISLSTWFRDYFYIPLGGNRVSRPKWYRNLFLTFLVSGLWHGANWTFVVWGALHGSYLVISILTAKMRNRVASLVGLTRVPRFHRVLQCIYIYALVCFAWIFFRANSLGDAMYVIRHMFDDVGRIASGGFDMSQIKSIAGALGLYKRDVAIIAGSILLLEGLQLLQTRGSIRAMLARRPLPLRWAAYYALIAITVFFGAFNQGQQFIYFQF